MSLTKRLALLIVFIFVVVKLPAEEVSRGKVALLFLTRANLNHPVLWHKLLEEASGRYHVYVHSAEPMTDPYFSPFRISKIVPTTWSVHVKAWQSLIREALKNPENEKFVFLSESCIPLYDLNLIYHQLMDDPRSHMAFSKPWWPSHNSREITELDPEFRFGNTEWAVLNRRHAEIVAKDVSLIRLISMHPNDQESYFGCLFAVHECLHEVVNHAYMYANWQYATNGGASPWHFTEVSEFNDLLLSEAYVIGALFARKFAKTYPQDVLLNMIEERTLNRTAL